MKAIVWAWKVLKSKPIIAALALGAGLVLAGECRSFQGASREAAAPRIAPPTREEARAEVVTLPCEQVQVLAPRPRDLERIAERYNRPDLAVRETPQTSDTPKILAERELPALPAGGTALVTLEPDGRTEVTIAPNPERLFEIRPIYELGGLAGVGTSGEARGRAWAAIEPLRWGRWHLRAEAGVELRAGEADAYAVAGAVWRSR